ncbi:MAG: efflux transporter periplasmic adaptor subunit, partial [Deltaproteobacteria bacterium]|nr:efflux transporter periplasmic adaptor subunit [Deltaproteobacteria bacterium]
DRALGDKWLVASGLAPGEQVIIEGVQKARPGAMVKAVPFASGNEKSSGERKDTTPQHTKSN